MGLKSRPQSFGLGRGGFTRDRFCGFGVVWVRERPHAVKRAATKEVQQQLPAIASTFFTLSLVAGARLGGTRPQHPGALWWNQVLQHDSLRNGSHVRGLAIRQPALSSYTDQL